MLLRRLGMRKRKHEDHSLLPPTRLSRQTPRALGRLGAHGRRAPAERGDVWGDDRGQKGYSFGQERDWMGRLEEDLEKSPASRPKGGVRQHRRPADGFDGSRTGKSAAERGARPDGCNCGTGC